MVQKLNNHIILFIVLISINCFSQNNDSISIAPAFRTVNKSILKTKDLALEVAKAQINLLKKEGAILVRLKTNATVIHKLKEAGNIDLATQIQKETFLSNQIIVDAFMKELTFCPVYFFYSDFSDSIRHNNLLGVFVDTNLVTNPTVVCKQSFYLIAEFGGLYNSSLPILNEENTKKAVEVGNYIKDVQVVLKNKYFFQLHAPFPYTQLKPASKEKFEKNKKGILKDEIATYEYLKKITNNSLEATKMKNYRGYVHAFNNKLIEFYSQYKDHNSPNEVMEFVY